MNRRELIGSALGGMMAARLAATGARAATGNPGTGTTAPLPRRERIRVAFMIGENANVIDTAGPWEVFQDTALPEDETRRPFDLFTVGPGQGMVRMTGGLKVKPDHSIRTAPQPHVIVVPAPRATDEMRAWLRRAAAGADVVMSVCTGAFQLAQAGLLDGHTATTHHEFWDSFAARFPHIPLERSARFVDNGRIATAGGLTSGIDLALHVVARYFGPEAAARTARYMEYQGRA